MFRLLAAGLIKLLKEIDAKSRRAHNTTTVVTQAGAMI